MVRKTGLAAFFDGPISNSIGRDHVQRFILENLDLLDECGGLSVDTWADGYGRIRISISYPLNTKDPGLRRRWKNLISEWLCRAVRFNKESNKADNYPPPFLQWLQRRERLERLKRLSQKKRDKWIKEEIDEASFRDGCSYQDCADSMNQWIGETMTEVLMFETDDSPQWNCIGKDKGQSIRDAMTFFNVPLDEQNVFFEEARRRFARRECVVPVFDVNHRKVRKPRPQGPITRQKVEAKVRQIRKAAPASTS